MEVQKTPRWKLLATAVLFLCSILVLGIYAYQQYQPQADLSRSGSAISVQATKQSYQDNVKKAEFLREKWKKWANNNKNLLKEMSHAQTDDKRTLMKVYNSLPTTVFISDKSGISHDDLHSGDIHFSWNPIAKIKMIPTTDPKLKQQEDSARIWTQKRLVDMFKKHRDIEISRSIGPGSTHITLWASGRVTETKTLIRNVPGEPVFVDSEPREIYPPYNFVR